MARQTVNSTVRFIATEFQGHDISREVRVTNVVAETRLICITSTTTTTAAAVRGPCVRDCVYFVSLMSSYEDRKVGLA